jgi:hypothetical protein
MQGQESYQPIPELKEIIREASRALALLDSVRLEELALSCHALNRRPMPKGIAEQARIGSDARRDLAVFGRMLEATQANLTVLRRTRRLREARLEYCTEETRALPRAEAESSNGDN